MKDFKCAKVPKDEICHYSYSPCLRGILGRSKTLVGWGRGMNERGSAMLTAVVSVMILLLISGIFFSIIVYKAKQDTSEENALRAYYLAEAGINYEEALVLQDYYYTNSDYHDNLVGFDQSNFKSDVLSNFTNPKPSPVEPFGDGGKFTVYIETDKDHPFTSTNIIVKSTGVYNGITRTLEEDYQYRKQ